MASSDIYTIPAWNFKISDNMRDLIVRYNSGQLSELEFDVFDEITSIINEYMNEEILMPSVFVDVSNLSIGDTCRVIEANIVENHLYAVCSIIISHARVPVMFTHPVELSQERDEETGVYYTYCKRIA